MLLVFKIVESLQCILKRPSCCCLRTPISQLHHTEFSNVLHTDQYLLYYMLTEYLFSTHSSCNYSPEQQIKSKKWNLGKQSPWDVSVKIADLKKFAIFTRKNLYKICMKSYGGLVLYLLKLSGKHLPRSLFFSALTRSRPAIWQSLKSWPETRDPGTLGSRTVGLGPKSLKSGPETQDKVTWDPGFLGPGSWYPGIWDPETRDFGTLQTDP